MKRTHTLIAGLIAAVLSGTAFAQMGKGCDGMGPMGMGPGMGPMAGQGGPMGRHVGMKYDPAQRAERHLSALKTELKLTAEQEPLWQAFAEKAQGQAGKGMAALRTQAADTKLSAPERMAQMETLMAERLTAMKGVHESFNRLYAALTPEQKAVADKHHAQMGQGMGPRQGGTPRGPGGPGRVAPPQG